MKLFTAIAILFISTSASAADMTIEMLNKDADGNKMVFSEEIARVDIGDIITWIPTTKGHNVEMISSPNDMKLKSKNGKEVKISFDKAGIYYYWCTPHKGMGMIGLVVVDGKLIEKPVLREMYRIVAIAERMGL